MEARKEFLQTPKVQLKQTFWVTEDSVAKLLMAGAKCVDAVTREDHYYDTASDDLAMAGLWLSRRDQEWFLIVEAQMEEAQGKAGEQIKEKAANSVPHTWETLCQEMTKNVQRDTATVYRNSTSRNPEELDQQLNWKNRQDQQLDWKNRPDQQCDWKNCQDQQLEGKNHQDQPLDWKNHQDHPLDGKNHQDQLLDGKNHQDQPLDGKNGQDQPLDWKNRQDQPLDGKNGQDQPLDWKNCQDQQLDWKKADPEPECPNSSSTFTELVGGSEIVAYLAAHLHLGLKTEEREDATMEGFLQKAGIQHYGSNHIINQATYLLSDRYTITVGREETPLKESATVSLEADVFHICEGWEEIDKLATYLSLEPTQEVNGE